MLNDLQTYKFNIRSVISSEAFAVFHLWTFRAETPPPMCLEFQTALPPPPPYAFRIPVQETPSPLEFQDATHSNGMDIFWNHSFAIDIRILFSFNSSKTEVRFPVNIGITGHVATTGEVSNVSNMTDHV